MTYLTVAQMREADRRCIEDIGIPGAVLMNNAGHAVFEHIQPGPTGIVCGRGNNGGDGFVVARYCLLAGYETRVLLLGPAEQVRGDAATFLAAYQNLGGRIESLATEEQARARIATLAGCKTLIDAMLGTGFTGAPRGLYRAAIEAWPAGPTTIAVDVPSGFDADTGEVVDRCIQAHTTITLQFPKIGFQNPAAARFLGEIHVADIGIPPVCADNPGHTDP